MATDTITVTTPTDHEIRITRGFAAPSAAVFQAWTDAALIPRWMTGPTDWTMPVCQSDPRPGGAFRFVFEKPGAEGFTISGIYEEVSPPDRLVTREAWGPDWPESLNTVELTESEGRTLATITMRYPTRAARDAVARIGMAEGLEHSFVRLDALLRTPG